MVTLRIFFIGVLAVQFKFSCATEPFIEPTSELVFSISIFDKVEKSLLVNRDFKKAFPLIFESPIVCQRLAYFSFFFISESFHVAVNICNLSSITSSLIASSPRQSKTSLIVLVLSESSESVGISSSFRLSTERSPTF